MCEPNTSDATPIFKAIKFATPEEPRSKRLARLIQHYASLLLPWVFIDRLRTAVLWALAGDLSSKGRFEKALLTARSMPAWSRKWSDWRLFEIQQLSLLNRHEETIEAANAFVFPFLLKAGLTEEQRYLLCYAQWAAFSAFANIGADSPIPCNFLYDLDSVSLPLVPPRTKRYFPLNIHPLWKNERPS
jgi:hypothetical protein